MKKKTKVLTKLVKNLGVLGIAFAILLSSMLILPKKTEAASEPVITCQGKQVKRIFIPKGESFSLDLEKGKKRFDTYNYYDELECKFSKEGIVSGDNGSFTALKKGTTKITISCKGVKASCKVQVIDELDIKFVSVKKSKDKIVLKLKNKTSKTLKVVNYKTTISYDEYYNGDEGGMNTANVKLKENVIIKPGMKGKIEVDNVSEYSDTASGLSLNIKYGKYKLRINAAFIDKEVIFFRPGWNWDF